MLSRKTTRILADCYDKVFSGRRTVSGPYGRSSRSKYCLKKEALYDYLFERDYDAWLLNAVKGLVGRERQLEEFLMRLHTGETLASVTPDWTWEQRRELGQRLLTNLAKDILVYTPNLGGRASTDVDSKTSQLLSQLELDGYLFRDGKLYHTEAAVLDTEHEQGILEKLIGDLRLDNDQVMKHHLELSETHYLEGKWDDSIANSRKFLESVLQEAAARHHVFKTGQPLADPTYCSPVAVRDYMSTKGLVEPKEKEAIAKVYGLLSGTGGHPYIAEKDQARLMRHLALTFAQFALLRLQGSIKSP
jgi:hypothetical protein